MKNNRIAPIGRFYLYTLHGYVTEIFFTAIWEFVVNQNWKFPGITSVWAGPIYGMTCMIQEKLFFSMKAKGIPLLFRCLVYTLCTYICEFSTGFILQQFGACPWDYTPFHGDFMGLVTLEYAPFWYFGSMVNEKFVMFYLFRIHIGPTVKEEELENSIFQDNTPVANGSISSGNKKLR